MGLPLRTRRFAAVAQEGLKQLVQKIEQGLRPMTNKDYQRVIRKYLIPFFGKYHPTSLDGAVMREFELWRNQQIGHMAVASTLATHAAAFNRVIDLAVEQGWLHKNNTVGRLSRRGQRAEPGQASHPNKLNACLHFYLSGQKAGTGTRAGKSSCCCATMWKCC